MTSGRRLDVSPCLRSTPSPRRCGTIFPVRHGRPLPAYLCCSWRRRSQTSHPANRLVSSFAGVRLYVIGTFARTDHVARRGEVILAYCLDTVHRAACAVDAREGSVFLDHQYHTERPKGGCISQDETDDDVMWRFSAFLCGRRGNRSFSFLPSSFILLQGELLHCPALSHYQQYR